MPALIPTKKLLLRWCGWFLLGNVILFWVLALKYLPTLFPGEFFALTAYGKTLVGIFIFLAYSGYLALLAFLSGFIIIPAIFLLPIRKIIFSLAITLTTLAATLLFTDAITYNLYRFHLYGIILNLVLHGLSEQIFGFSTQEYFFGVGIFGGIFLFELFYALLLWQYFIKPQRGIGTGKWYALFLLGCTYLSYTMVVFSVGQPINRIFTDNARFLPFYYEFILPTRNGQVALERNAEREFLHPQQNSQPLHYPLQSNLQCATTDTPLNLVIIVIDAWRFDMLNAAITPSLVKFASKSWVFNQHFSGGNATGPGLFSLFYGLPATYWTAMELQHQGPVLLEELMRRHYRMGIFSSATLKQPALDKTIFSEIKNLRIGSRDQKDAYRRDQMITREFKQFITQQHSQPFFSFLFYDAAHSYCAIDEDLQPLQPVVKNCGRFQLTAKTDITPYFNRYKNALLLVDQQIAIVMQTLAARHLLEHTVVIVTGDHGEEFNDNQLGYWGHASNFTRYQVRTPLIVYWPGQKPRVVTHSTSHFDIVPTLLTRLLGCKTKTANYSVGNDLLNSIARPYFVIGSYIDFGVVEPERITTIFPLGNFEVDQLNGRPLLSTELNVVTLQKAWEDMKKFYL